MSIADIRAALEGRLAILTPKLPIQFDNVNYTPVVGKPWLRATLLVSQTEGYLGLNAAEKWQGIFQIAVFVPSNTAMKVAESKAQALLDHFSKGLSLSKNGIYVQIEQPYLTVGVSEPDWSSILVRVPWHTYIT